MRALERSQSSHIYKDVPPLDINLLVHPTNDCLARVDLNYHATLVIEIFVGVKVH